MNMVVFGIYGTRRQVENAVEELKAEGFKSTEISVLFPENAAMPGFASEGAVAGTIPDAMIAEVTCAAWSTEVKSARSVRTACGLHIFDYRSTV